MQVQRYSSWWQWEHRSCHHQGAQTPTHMSPPAKGLSSTFGHKRGRKQGCSCNLR